MAPKLMEREEARRIGSPRVDGRGHDPLWYDQALGSFAMNQPPSLLTPQFLTWVADRPRTRADMLAAWHSCPRSSAFEDCVVDGLVRFENGHISLTERGRALLDGRGAPSSH